MALPKPLEAKDIRHGANVWFPVNGEPKEGTVISVFPNERIMVHVDDSIVSVPCVYTYREDVVTIIAHKTQNHISKYKKEIGSVKDLLRFACRHMSADSDSDKAAILAFRLRACDLLGANMDELFYN